MFWCILISLMLTVHGQSVTSMPMPNIPNFIPFGLDNSDTTVTRQLDAMTPPIMITTRFPYFNEYYDEIKLSSHGLILFGNRSYVVPHASPGQFPIPDFICVAPYWADTDTTQDRDSDIFYREINIEDTNNLLRITAMVRNGFPELSVHSMIWAFVATWYRVPGHYGYPGRNTYQAILTTNGLYSFVLLTYYQLEWADGMWGGYPQVGFNAGDQINYLTLDSSFSPDVMKIVNTSNIGVPGQYVFHTTGNVSDVNCDTPGGLTSTPTRGSVYGGYELRLHGICFNETSYHVEIDGQIINCQLFGSLYVNCIMPMVFGGKIVVKLLSDIDNRLIATTDFVTFVPEDNAEVLLANYAELTQLNEAMDDADEFIMRFRSNTITNKYLFNITVYDYAAQMNESDGSLFGLVKRRVDLGLTNINLSYVANITVRYDSIISATEEPNGRVHSLGFTFEPVSAARFVGFLFSAVKWGFRIYRLQKFIRDNYCKVWLNFQPDASYYINQIPPCPCRVQTTWNNDFMGYTADSKCDGRQPADKTCSYHKGARGCYRKKSETTPAGAQCCYDAQGVWITDPDKGAGTLDAHMPTLVWNSLPTYMPTLDHYFSDVMSYESCCTRSRATKATCKAYHEKRPAGRCENIWPVPIGGNGDPHFSALYGESFTFNGYGEYTLLKVPWVDIEAQVRLEPIDNGPTSEDRATAITAIAIKNGNQSRVQFELIKELHLLEIRIDSKLLELDPFDEELSLFFDVIYTDDEHMTIRRTNATSFEISYSNNNIQCQIHLRPTFDFMDLLTVIPRSLLGLNTQGLLGDLKSLVYPNGERLFIENTNDETLFTYGESWRTKSNTSLFYYHAMDSHENHQNPTYRPMFHEQLFKKYQNTSRLQLAHTSCGGVERQSRRNCVYDILITNDSTISAMHHSFQSSLVEWRELAKLVEEDSKGQVSASARSMSMQHVWYLLSSLYLAIFLH